MAGLGNGGTVIAVRGAAGDRSGPGLQVVRDYANRYADAPKADDPSKPSIAQFHVTMEFMHRRMQGGSKYAAGDFFLIGSGLLLGAAAGIWAVIDVALTRGNYP